LGVVERIERLFGAKLRESRLRIEYRLDADGF
jgi:hypothetical protein